MIATAWGAVDWGLGLTSSGWTAIYLRGEPRNHYAASAKAQMRQLRAGRPQKKLSPARALVTRRIRRLFDIAHDGNLREAAGATGIPYTTVRDLYHGRSTQPSIGTLQAL